MLGEQRVDDPPRIFPIACAIAAVVRGYEGISDEESCHLVLCTI